MLSVLAGAYISFGALFLTIAVTGSELGWGPTQLLGGVAFSLGFGRWRRRQAVHAPELAWAVCVRSMGHEDWDRHRLKNGSCGAPQDELAQTAVAICAHDDEIGANIAGVRQERLTGVNFAPRQPFRGRLDTVARQSLGQLRTGV
jgi:hypothetical protein